LTQTAIFIGADSIGVACADECPTGQARGRFSRPPRMHAATSSASLTTA